MIQTMTMKLQAAGLAAPAVAGGARAHASLAVRRAAGLAIFGSGLAVIVAQGLAHVLGG